MRNAVGACLAMAISAGALMAQDLPDAKAAQKLLFPTRAKAVDVIILDEALSAGISTAAIKKNAPYYSAFAVSPTSGFIGISASAALNFHSVAAAGAAAVADCNAKREKSEKPCVVVMQVVPLNYAGRRSFQLNGDASKAFRKQYRRKAGPKAFAISESTGQWGFHVKAASDEQAAEQAIAKCAAKIEAGKKNDCKVVSVN